ncbi:hypothetical protein [Falsiroseomonas sp. HW251]|uniref:hypothetical protein n=1 Tax=Falsiroseomonas sp. HW251 TaxID=3390998 RepID=UPI003D31D540
MEQLVDRLSPPAVIAVFILPFVPIIPILKVAKLWLLAHHHYVWAALTIAGGKIVGAAFSTRVYAIARPKMVQVRWFSRLEAKVVWLLDFGHRTLENIPAWVTARALGRRLVQSARASIAATWIALRRKVTSERRSSFSRRWALALRRIRSRWSA